MDRLYLENNAFEKLESFASVFFGIVDPTRRMMMYTNAGHEPVVVIFPDGSWQILHPTAPLVGVFADKHNLFKQAFVDLPVGTLFVGATDGVTEARNGLGDFFGMDRFVAAAVAARALPEGEILKTIMADVQTFRLEKRQDDIAITAVRFL
jgi:sigma-B regulation protein RsbU (phosphoserine phosphatase)